MSVSTNPSARGRKAAAAPARRVRRLSGRDKLVLGLMVGIPTLIQLVLVWIPTLMSVGLSFTRWNGLELTDIKPAGVENYLFIAQDYPPFWPAMQHNLLWLAFPHIGRDKRLRRRCRGSSIVATCLGATSSRTVADVISDA